MSLFGGGHKSAAQTPTRAMGIDLQGAQYGAPIPVVFGRNKLAGNVIWYGDFKATAHTQKQGGKGGGGQKSTSYTYSCSYLLGLCEGPATINAVYDGASTTSLSGVGGLGFSGTIAQAPWAHLSGSAALGYSGTALAAFQNKDLGSSASLPNYNFVMDGRNQFGGGVVDANPADIVTAICTDSQIGVQFNALGDLTAFKTYCTAAGIFFSPVYATQNPAQQTLDDLLKYANSAAFFSEGVLKVVPYGDTTITGNGVTYTPNLTAVADLGRDDFITNGPGDPVTVKRIAPADAMNIQRVEFKDRANTYHTGTVVASIDQDVVATGARADQSDSVDMITTAPVARLVAQNLLQRTYYIRNTYEFQLSWRYCYLEPMDVVTLTDANTGLYLSPVRITEISEDEHGLLSVVAEEFPIGTAHGGTYATQANAGATVDPNADPGPIDGPYLFRGPGFLVSNATPEIWCALIGNDPLWAGCDVYLSHDGTSYTYLTTTSRRAAYGVLSNTLAANADPDTTGAPNVLLNGPAQLLGGTQADADQFVTLAMLDSEIIAYQTATLAGGPSYTLGYLRRGGYGSAIAAHAANAPFVRLDENILRIPVDPSQIGLTVYLKFVSFNVFGKGGRTLASETAYPYVIGTNVELPDVPVTPASFAAQSVADGVSLTWTNPNPAAVDCTSIEYATASTGPWTVLAQVGPTATSFPHHFTTGATYYYRARSRGPLVSAGFSAYTATVSNAGVNVAAIATAASAANANTPSVINPQFRSGTDGWSFDNPAGFYQNSTDGNSPDSACPSHLVRQGQAGGATTYARNTGYVSVVPGQTITAVCCLQSFSANAGSYAGCRISWRDASHIELSTTLASITVGPGGPYTHAVSKAVGQAPAGASFAHFELYYVNHSSGYINATSCGLSVQPASTDEVPDGSTYARVRAGQLSGGILAVLATGRNLIPNPNFTSVNTGQSSGVAYSSGQLVDNWTITGASAYYGSGGIVTRANPNIAVAAGGSAYGGVVQSTKFAVSAGFAFALRITRSIGASASLPSWLSIAHRIWIVWLDGTGAEISRFTQDLAGLSGTVQQIYSGTIPSNAVSAYCVLTGYYVNSSGSAQNSGALYCDFGTGNVTFVESTNLATEVAGTLSTQKNLPSVTFGNFGAAWNGLSLSYTSTTTSATISASAATLQAGSDPVAYNASSVTVSGSAGSTVTYYLYYDDPGMTGGAKTLQATTSQITSVSNNGRVSVATLKVTYPTSGSGGGTGGGSCVWRETFVRRKTATGYEDVLAGDIVAGDRLRIMNPATGAKRWGVVSYSQPKLAPCVRFVTADGVGLSCSTTAPIGTTTGTIPAPDLLGCIVPADDHGALTRAAVTCVQNLGEQWVQHITCEDDFFLAGNEPARYVAHHNLKPPTP